MKIKILLLAVALLSAVAHAQVIVGNYSVTYVSAAPSGACFQSAPLQFLVPTGHLYGCQNGTWADITGSGGGSGTVTSVALRSASPNLFSGTAGTAVTTAGTLDPDAQLITQTANCIVSGPISGGATRPTCRAMVSADIPSSIALANGITATTQATGDNSTKLATTAYVDIRNSVPPWLQWEGDGSEAAPNCAAGCTVNNEHWYASVNIPIGQTMIDNTAAPLIIRSTGTCTIAGTVSVSANTGGASGNSAGGANYGGAGGGGGFGAANGTAGTLSSPAGGGAAGTSGVSGGNGGAAGVQKTFLSGGPNLGGTNQAGTTSVVNYGGAPGGAGGSSGGAGGKGGGAVIFDCQTVNFTGTIDASGVNGGAGGANTGGGGGGGGGFVVLRSPNMTNSGSISTANGTGGAIGTGTSTKGGDGGAGWSKVFSQ